MTGNPPPHGFDAQQARPFVANPEFTKTAILIETADGDSLTVLATPFGEQKLKGSFYAVAEGSESYGASQTEFEQNNEQVAPNQWVKRGEVRAYRTNQKCEITTEIDGEQETTVVANPGDWIVRQATGEVMVIKPAQFAERYVAKESPAPDERRSGPERKKCSVESKGP